MTLVDDVAALEAMPNLPLRVQCCAGYQGEETPRRFSLGERHIEVVEVLDRWLAPDHRYFKVKGDDSDTYIMRHDVTADRWELTVFERTRDGFTPL